MGHLKCVLTEKGIVELTNEESGKILGGNWLVAPPFVAISAVTGAAMCIFEFGKATGNFIYHVTH
jgi:hypothetical protein